MGGKKGGKSHTPVEAKETGRSFQVLRILEVISEGEIYGLVNDMKSVYLDKTPLANADGTFNFKNVEVYATAGTQSQDTLHEFNAVEREIEVGTKILLEKPVIKTISDVNVTRVRMTVGVERLMRTEDNGDINPNSVLIKITVLKNNSIYSTRDYSFQGKYSNPYREMFEIDSLPKAPFQIKVERLTKESTSNKIFDNVFWGSYTEIIDENFAYPNTALVGIKIDSEYFSNAPVRNYEIYGLIVQVPSNYDAFNHRYTSDFWDGTFKLSWTNNPAWIFYDLVTNTRYGLGEHLKNFHIDKWQLYAIGRYCDEMVNDGYGGREPRMTCNIWITDQRKAHDLILDLASVFRGMPVWNGQALTAIQDRVADPVWTYNNANVIGGFSRQRSARKARHNTIHVQYIDAEDFYEKKVECVTDDKLVARFGEVIKKVTAFGCTSRGQAYRTGRWLLETEKLETETITFTVGQEGVNHLPYDIIEVADNEYAGVNIGGRILNVNRTQVTLDREIQIDSKSYLSYISSQGRTEQVKILSFDTATKIATVAKDLTGTPEYAMWALTTQRITTGLYRVISIKENDKSNSKTYTITAIQHVPEKEDIVTNGTYFEPRPQTIYGEVTAVDVAYDGKKLTFNGKVNNNVNPLQSKSATNYTIKVLKDNALLYIKKGLKSPDLELDDLENGSYEIVIQSFNEHGQLLHTKTQHFVIDRPPLVSGVEIVPNLTEIWLRWNYVNDITQTEIWVNTVDNIKTATLLATVSAVNYTHSVGAKQTRYYWLRHKRGINLGLFDQVQGRACTSEIDLDEKLTELNKELSKNIVDEIIDVALPARKLDMVLTVENVENPTTYLNHRQLYNEADGKLWVWNGTRYEPDSTEVLASAIKGIIQPSQLATIPTTKLTGSISDAMLQSVSANKIAGVINANNLPTIPTTKLGGVISDSQIQALNATKLIGSVPIANVPNIPTNKLTGLLTSSQIQALDATKITGTLATTQIPSIPTTKLTGKVGANLIEANSIGANHIASNAVTADKILANAIDSTKIKANAITGDKINANAISADKIASNAITTEKINSSAITSTKIASNAITADKILAGSINAQKIASNAIEAQHIKANAIGANAIQAGVIGTNHIATNSIDATKLRANSVGANAIQANAITAQKIESGAITSAKISAGAINAGHIQAGQISADKLAIGLGGNLLYNPIFANNADGWRDFGAKVGDWSNAPVTNAIGRGYHINDYNPKGEKTEEWRLVTLSGTTAQFNTIADRNASIDVCRQFVEVVAGNWYIASMYVGGFRCAGQLLVEPYSSDERTLLNGVLSSPIIGAGDIHNKPSNFIDAPSGYFQKGLSSNVKRVFIKFQAPTTGKIFLIFRVNRYAKNVTYADFYCARPMLEEISPHINEPSAWQNAGVTSIHGGSIKTRTITAQHLQANTITANEIASGTITGNKISGKTITADKISIQNLSSVSSNLGSITGGSININNKFIVDSNGNVKIQSSTGNTGLRITNERIDVYNDRGVLMTRMGKLD